MGQVKKAFTGDIDHYTVIVIIWWHFLHIIFSQLQITAQPTQGESMFYVLTEPFHSKSLV